jgi:hypothetical protein
MKLYKALGAAMAAGMVFLPASARAVDFATHLFTLMDGDVYGTKSCNSNEWLEVGHSGKKSVGWMAFQTGGSDLAQASGATLTLHLEDVYQKGTLKIYALTAPVPFPEDKVTASQLIYNAKAPVASVAIGYSDEGKIIRVNLGQLLSKGPFYGLVIGSPDGLRADFGSKDSDVPPMIELRYAAASMEDLNKAIEGGTGGQGSAAAASASATAAAASATTAQSAASTATDKAAASAASAASAAQDAMQTGLASSNAGASAAAAAGSAAQSAASASAAAGSAAAAANEASQAAASATAAEGSATQASASSGAADASAKASDVSAKAAAAAANQANLASSGAAGSAMMAFSAASDVAGAVAVANAAVNQAQNNASSAAQSAGDAAVSASQAQAAAGAVNGIGLQVQAQIDVAQGHAAAAAASATAAESSAAAALAAAASMADAGNFPAGTSLLNRNPNPPPGFAATGIRLNFETPWLSKSAPIVARSEMGSAVAGGKLYAVGGTTGSGALSTVMAYDPVAGTWTNVASLPGAVRQPSVVEYGGKLYSTGGIDAGNNAQGAVSVYDPASNAWTALAPMPARFGHASAAFNGKIYVFGGAGSIGFAHVAATSIYDIASGVWTTGATMPTWRAQMQAREVNGKIYVVGGATSGTPLAQTAVNEVYDPETDTWSVAAPLPTARSGFGMLADQGRLYIVGGEAIGGSASAPINACIQYDAASDSWVPLNPMLQARKLFALGLINGKVYASLGFGAAIMNSTEEYKMPKTVYLVEKL